MNKSPGFTLIELLVTMVVVAILLAIAVPSYRDYVIKGARANAKATMLDIAQMEERFLANQATYHAYANSATAAGFPPFAGNDFGSRKYDISVSAGATGSIITSYAITAVPTNGFSDPTCGSLVLDSIGNKTSSSGNSACW